METIYAVTRKGVIVGPRVFRTLRSAKREKELKDIVTCREHDIISIKLPFAKRSVCLLRKYCGYDYNYFDSIEPIYDIVSYSEMFACADYAKKHDWWKNALKDAEENPKRFHVTNDMIASDDHGEPFIYGDCFMGKYNVSIVRFKVIE